MERKGGAIFPVFPLLLAVLALTVPAGGIGIADGPTDAGAGTVTEGRESTELAEAPQVREGAAPQLDIDADDITMEATIRENGTASMEIDYRIELNATSTDPETEAFEQLQEEVANDPDSYLDPFKERINRTVDAARTITGRQMTAREFSITTERDSQLSGEFGHVRFRFEWTGFAETGGGTIQAGDAVDALFLDNKESLVFRWPAEYGVQSSDPEPERTESGSAVWRGPLDFDSGQPRVTLSTDAADDDSGAVDNDSGATDGGTNGGNDGAPDGGSDPAADDGGSGLAVVPIMGTVGLVLLAGAAAVWFVRREGSAAEKIADGQETGGTTPPDELLSNEERVLQLLQQNGGRMKQKKVAEQLDWTAAKTSQVVGDLREDDEVDSFRLGRENVLTLPDVDIEGGTTDDTSGDGDDTGSPAS